MLRSAVILLACCGLPLATARPAAAAPAPVTNVNIAFALPTTDRGLYLSTPADCLLLTGGWSINSTRRYFGTSASPRGLLDVAGRSGEKLRALLAATFGDPALDGQILTPRFTSTDLAPS